MPGKKALLQLPVPGGKLSKLGLLNFGNLSGNIKSSLHFIFSLGGNQEHQQESWFGREIAKIL